MKIERIKINILKISKIDSVEKEKLKLFIKDQNACPYQYLEYQNMIKEVFNYQNVSLVAISSKNTIEGYVAQWIVGKEIVSIPWRDRGGPIYKNEEVLETLIKHTEKIVREYKLKGFIWKDFCCSNIPYYEYFKIVELNLYEKSELELWNSIKNRRNIRKAEKLNLHFIPFDNRKNVEDNFYKLFVETRRRLGVPSYSKEYFKKTLNNLKSNSAVFSVEDESGKLLAMMIVVYNQEIAIYSYGASDACGNIFRANEFLMWNTILEMKRLGIKKFDFGADSPIQENLIKYKLKWGSHIRNVCTSYKGNIKEVDHNLSKYNLVRKIISLLPKKLYLILSKIIVR